MESADSDLLHILVIDDDDDMRDVVTRILIAEGHQVFAVESAEAGLELLPINTFQVAFLDQNLPGMDGLVLGEYLRRNNEHMTITLVTGSDDERLEHRGEAHDIRVIRKPFEVTELLDVVSAYRKGAAERLEQRLNHEAPDFEPPVPEFFFDLNEAFAMPNISDRIQDRLFSTIKSSLAELRTVSRYNERHRVHAYSGLVTAQVLGLKAPKLSSGRNLFEEYDHLMREHGRREEFCAPPAPKTKS